AYIEHLTRLPVTCLIAGTYMHMASEISLVTSIGKVESLRAHIVLKLPFLLQNDVLRNLDTVINLTDVTHKTRECLGYILRGRPRNCASFVRKLISERELKNMTKDQEIRELIHGWFERMALDMAVYLEDACSFLGANSLNPEIAILDVLRLRVFYNHNFKQAIKLLQHSIIPCQSPECIVLSRHIVFSDVIKFNPLLESYLVSGIEVYFLKKGKTLVDIFVDNISRFNNISSIGNEFDAVFITSIIQKRGCNVRKELNKWKNGQDFNLPSWITPTMKFMTISNLSGGIPIAKYVGNMTHYRSYAIQPDIYSGSDVVISLADDEQNVVLLSTSCTVSGEPIKR
ncbi:679_t:CDS:1, partial [Acaulospora morrowiae]